MATASSFVAPASPAITLGEGNTPLVPSRWIGPQLGLDHLFFKLEQVNPTGSYKDRFAARLVSLLLAGGHRLCLAMSSGNTGAAVAAYAAAAGIPCVLCVPEEAPPAKLVQIRACGAQVLRVRGMIATPQTLRNVLERLSALAARRALPLGVSAYACSPQAMVGIEPLSAEIVRDLGRAPDRVFCPVGGGGLLTATWRGFLRLDELARGQRSPLPARPRIHAVQPARNDTVVSALHAGEPRAREVTTATTVTRISGLGVPLDLDATAALQAVRASGGDGHLVDDEFVWEIQALLAQREGLYVEPAGAASVAGLWVATRSGTIGRTEYVVCLLTGHGFKDAAAARRLAARAAAATGRPRRQAPTVEAGDLDDALLDRLLAGRA